VWPYGYPPSEAGDHRWQCYDYLDWMRRRITAYRYIPNERPVSVTWRFSLWYTRNYYDGYYNQPTAPPGTYYTQWTHTNDLAKTWTKYPANCPIPSWTIERVSANFSLRAQAIDPSQTYSGVDPDFPYGTFSKVAAPLNTDVILDWNGNTLSVGQADCVLVGPSDLWWNIPPKYAVFDNQSLTWPPNEPTYTCGDDLQDMGSDSYLSSDISPVADYEYSIKRINWLAGTCTLVAHGTVSGSGYTDFNSTFAYPHITPY
jgi:hypothetical protein